MRNKELIEEVFKFMNHVLELNHVHRYRKMGDETSYLSYLDYSQSFVRLDKIKTHTNLMNQNKK